MNCTGEMIDLDAGIRALAHPFRRNVLKWLADPATYFTDADCPGFRAVSAGMLHARSGLSQSTVSGHLSQLERAGLIKAKKIGQWVFFSRNEDVIRELARCFCSKVAGIDLRL